MTTQQQINALIAALSLSQDSLMDKARQLGQQASYLYKQAQTLINDLRNIELREDGENAVSLAETYRLADSASKAHKLMQEIASA
ncbi:TPA: hypothetical protein ACPVZG_004113 [Vibrio parahaemolyticus]|uniref:Uncharacterized protein n=1 Tax=Vibrio parahaemolyticus TaxID=670 RepID=A0AAW8Q0A7_VIBPH|nr:hypothetical protein [Vibrio parahaemolyticus]EGR2229631.1 hypothetical protein [Vibrio parahaemolyticus]MDS1821024.1 hypothetical protein [Vibrio parahaemolyticus]